MIQPADRTIESVRAAHLQTVEATRAVAAQILTTAATALYAAAATVFMLMVVIFIRVGVKTGVTDWPGRYWFAVLPLVVAGVTLHLGAHKMGRPPVPAPPTDWYR